MNGGVRRRIAAATLVVAALGCSSTNDPSPWFEEVAAERGLGFAHRSGHDGRHLFPESVAGGAALFDMDGDGDLDAYLVQGGSLAGSDGGDGNRLYANDGAGRFRDVTDGSGAGNRGYGMGAAAADYDNDGDVDLYVTNYGANALLRNDGRGRFTDVSAAAGVAGDDWSLSAAFFDYDRDGDLDLFVANYVNWTPAIEQDCYNVSGLLDYCLPTNYNAPAMDRLYRNDGGGRFADVSVAAGLQAAFGNGMGVVTADFDADGWPDVFVANDTMTNQLWRNQGDGTFVDEALLRGCALDQDGRAKAGMGVVAEDRDQDGDPDLLVVNLLGESDSFFDNESGIFVDRTGEVGLAGAGQRFTRFGVGMQDFDNDGRLDLFEANGRVMGSAEPWADDVYAEPDLLYRGTADGRFVEVQPAGGTDEPRVATGRGAAFGDIDNDGGVDVLIVNRDHRAHLLRNVAPRGRWVRFRVLDEHGRDALGARVELTAGGRRRYGVVRAAYSYASSNDPRVHFGLGNAGAAAEVVVRWVDGTSESFGEFAAGGDVTLQRGAGF